jgi:hypothetical protein
VQNPSRTVSLLAGLSDGFCESEHGNHLLDTLGRGELQVLAQDRAINVSFGGVD